MLIAVVLKRTYIHFMTHSTVRSPPHLLCCCRYDKQIRLLQREVKDAEEEAVMCNTATTAGAYGQMANPKYISSSEDRKLALKHYKNKQDMLKVSNLAIVILRVSIPRCAVCLH